MPGVQELSRTQDSHSKPIFVPDGLIIGNELVTRLYVSESTKIEPLACKRYNNGHPCSIDFLAIFCSIWTSIEGLLAIWSGWAQQWQIDTTEYHNLCWGSIIVTLLTTQPQLTTLVLELDHQWQTALSVLWQDFDIAYNALPRRSVEGLTWSWSKALVYNGSSDCCAKIQCAHAQYEQA